MLAQNKLHYGVSKLCISRHTHERCILCLSRTRKRPWKHLVLLLVLFQDRISLAFHHFDLLMLSSKRSDDGCVVRFLERDLSSSGTSLQEHLAASKSCDFVFDRDICLCPEISADVSYPTILCLCR